MKFVWNAIFIVQFGAWVSSEQVVLVEKPKQDQWSWRAFLPATPALVSGWVTRRNPQNRPRYETCGFNPPSQPNNWLRSDRIIITEANRVDVTVEYNIQACSGSFCTEKIDLYVNQSDTPLDVANYPSPLSNVETYTKFGSVNDDTGAILKETIPLTINKKYILVAFHDQGGCKSLRSVKVTYYFCPEQTLMKNLVSLPRTVAPANDSDNFQANGSCMANTVPLPGSLLVRCQSDGEWNASGLEGNCVCKEGMENINGTCKDCPDGKYNMNKGMNCSLCPDNSESTNDKKSCSCKDSYYRAPGESITKNCTAIPSAPKQATTSFVNQSTVVLQWSPPDDNGGRNDVYYDVECRKPCEDDDDKDCVYIPCRDDVMYIPASKRLNATKVTVQNLLSFVNYTFRIYAKNGVSEMAVGKTFTSFDVKTNGSVPGIPEVSVAWLAETSVARVSWTLQRKNGVIKEYHVTHTREDDSSGGQPTITQGTSVDIEELKAEKTYKFQVLAVNQFGQGPPGAKMFKIPKGGLSEKWIIVFAAVGGALLLVMIIMIIVFCYRRKHPKNLESYYMRTLEQGLDMQSPDQQQYIDPNDYLDIKQLLTAFTAELDRNVIKLEGLIGSGEFADVYKGIIKTQEGKMFVAVKILRPGSSEKNQKDFLSEASIMGQFKHHNVIELVGVVTESQPMMIATELLESGSLEHFLKEREGQLTNLQLLGMARGVASGMVYLSEMNFIHRDIAARNILVGENMSCKVTDFGLSRELADDNPDSEYETQGGKVPVRWTAPEALQHRKFSSASDVWSYGILLWEIMSFCDRPYWQWNNYDVISRVETGYRLPSPKGCPSIIHQLMLECWDADRNKRPKFADIVSRLDELIRSPEFLKDDLAHLVSASTEVDFTDVQTVDDWLKKINMDKYSEIFHAANMENLDQVMQLQEKDLKEMGISLIGHRNKMTKSIKALKAKYINEGFDEGEGAI